MSSLAYSYESDVLDLHIDRAMNEKPLGHFGLEAFDRLIDGIHPSRFTVVCAEPGMSKTTLFGQLADEAAAAGFVSVVNTLEVPAYQWVAKSLARMSGGTLSVSDVADPAKHDLIGQIAEAYRRAIAPNVVFIEKDASSVELGAVVAKIQQERSLPVILWQDYIQIMPSDPGAQAFEERLAIKGAVAGLRHVASAHEIPVFAISSVNRANYGKAPALGALGGSSALEYGVDTALYLEIDGKGGERETNMELPIRPLVLTAIKNRYAPKGSSKLSFDCAHATFSERF